MLKISMNLIFTALIVLCLGIFTSISISAVSHIFMAIAITLFILHDPKAYWSSLLERKHLAYSLMALIAVIIVSVLVNWGEIERPLKNILKIKYFLIPLLSTPVLSHFFKSDFDKKKIKILFYLFLLATTVATVSGLIGLYTGFNPLKFKAACHETRACGLYGMYMTYGYGISLFMVLMTGTLIYVKEFKKIISPLLLAPVWLINFAGLILSYARGGLLGFVASVPFFAFKKDSIKFLLICLFLGSALASSVLLSPKLQNMFFNRSASNMQRVAFYKTAIKAASEKPVFGWGYKNYEPNVTSLKKKYNIEYPEYGADAHNIFLEALASTGIAGLLIFLYFFITWGRVAFINDSLVHRLSFPFVVSLAISGQVQNIFGDGENLFFIMLVWSIMAALTTKKEPTT